MKTHPRRALTVLCNVKDNADTQILISTNPNTKMAPKVNSRSLLVKVSKCTDVSTGSLLRTQLLIKTGGLFHKSQILNCWIWAVKPIDLKYVKLS